IDPRDRTSFYYAMEGGAAGLEFEIDWRAGTSRPRSIYWLGENDPAAPPGVTGPETSIYVDGRQYMTDVYNSQPIGGPIVGNVWLMRGGVAVRVASLGRADQWPLLTTPPFRARWPARADPDKTSAAMVYAWSDLNGDGRVTPDEITIAPDHVGSLTLDAHLGFCTSTATVYAPTGFTAAGAPLYDARGGRRSAGDFALDSVGSGSGQVRALRDGWVFSSGGPVRGFHDGSPRWTYPNEWPGQQAGVLSTPPTHAGELMATARMLPQTITPRGGDAGELVALNGDKGDVFLMTADGLFVSTLFHDVRQAPSWNMPAATRGMSVADVSLHEESFWTNLTQTDDGDVFVVGGHHHSSIVRVDGLETTRRFTAPPLVLTPARAEVARLYRVRVEAARQARAGRDLMTISLRHRPIAVDGKLDDWHDAQWVIIDEPEGRLGAELGRIEAAAAVVGPRLYLAFRAKDRALLRNSGESPQMSFATGGALDLMLGTNAAADPRRDRAAAGDLRLVVTRVAGKPRAMLYRPRVPGRRGPPVAFASPWRTVELDEVDDVSSAVELAQGDGAYELSVPLATLGLTARDGLELRGDVGVLRGDGARTLQRLYWQNKATSTVSDIPTEATLTPQLWGRMRFVADPR
ncbi:MAG TPA: hypothetical protein VH560_08175, partial [Polyangia bacterium]|nr:hypothetical protein [Polyangia bacterium]